MLKIFLCVLRRVLGTWPNGRVVHAAFEWPKSTAGWQQVEVQQICQRLMHRVDFDGCALGLEKCSGQLLRRPWRVQTSMRELCEPYVYVMVHMPMGRTVEATRCRQRITRHPW
jgi:hypothetical protein